MDTQESFNLETEESFSIRVEEPSSTKKSTISSWFQRIITLDDLPNQKHHPPIFIIVMSILHVFLYFLTYIDTTWRYQKFEFALFDLCKFFVPCMRPAPQYIRTHIASCRRSVKNETCHYDDVLKYACFSFTYPYQMWRMLTVNILHTAWLHLVSNLLAQLLQGIPLERKYGSIRVVVIYWLSDLGANLSFTMKNREGAAAGASGALYGLMLFLVVDRLIAIQTNPGRRRFIIVQLAFLLLPHIVASVPLIIKYNVAHSAHLGGGLVGFLLGVSMIGCPWPWSSEHYTCRTTCRQMAFVFLSLYYVITIFIFFLIDVPVVRWIL